MWTVAAFTFLSAAGSILVSAAVANDGTPTASSAKRARPMSRPDILACVWWRHLRKEKRPSGMRVLLCETALIEHNEHDLQRSYGTKPKPRMQPRFARFSLIYHSREFLDHGICVFTLEGPWRGCIPQPRVTCAARAPRVTIITGRTVGQFPGCAREEGDPGLWNTPPPGPSGVPTNLTFVPRLTFPPRATPGKIPGYENPSHC